MFPDKLATSIATNNIAESPKLRQSNLTNTESDDNQKKESTINASPRIKHIKSPKSEMKTIKRASSNIFHSEGEKDASEMSYTATRHRNSLSEIISKWQNNLSFLLYFFS